MAGYTIANQQSLHYLTLTVVGWVDVFFPRLLPSDSFGQLGVLPERKGAETLAVKPEHYRYSSASNYLTGEGVFPVMVLDDIWSDGKWR